MSQQRGVKFGIAENCGVGFSTTNDAALEPFPQEARTGNPVYRVQAEGREWVTMFSPQAIAKVRLRLHGLDDVDERRGQADGLWIPSEVEIGDKQAFMDMLVERTVGILTNEPIDIYVNPTFLPAAIADEYDAAFWTDERMDKVIDAAVKNGVAIEINARYVLPSEFVRKAKAASATFSFGTNNGGKDDLGQLEYSLMIAVAAA